MSGQQPTRASKNSPALPVGAPHVAWPPASPPAALPPQPWPSLRTNPRHARAPRPRTKRCAPSDTLPRGRARAPRRRRWGRGAGFRVAGLPITVAPAPRPFAQRPRGRPLHPPRHRMIPRAPRGSPRRPDAPPPVASAPNPARDPTCDAHEPRGGLRASGHPSRRGHPCTSRTGHPSRRVHPCTRRNGYPIPTRAHLTSAEGVARPGERTPDLAAHHTHLARKEHRACNREPPRRTWDASRAQGCARTGGR